MKLNEGGCDCCGSPATSRNKLKAYISYRFRCENCGAPYRLRIGIMLGLMVFALLVALVLYIALAIEIWITLVAFLVINGFVVVYWGNFENDPKASPQA